MNKVADQIHGYTYGTPETAVSSITLHQLKELKNSVGMSIEDERYLQIAGEVLANQTEQIVEHWRDKIIVAIPNLARHSKTPEGSFIPEYMAKSNLRFQQWILDTCFRQYDQTWINYQQEIALRHTSQKKNQIDGVRSTPYVPLRDIIAFTAVMNETIKPYLAAKEHTGEEIEKMHRAWCKSLQLQVALWTHTYMNSAVARHEW